MTTPSPTFLELVAAKYGEIEAGDSPACFCGAVGQLSVELHCLVAELALPPSQQDSENVLEILVGIGVICAAVAEDLVLPELREEAD